MAEATLPKLSSAHFYAWQQGLKTGQYYLRTRPARDAIKFTLNVESLMKVGSDSNNSDLFNYNSRNMTQAELDQSRKVKKRKANDIANTTNTSTNEMVQVAEFKQPAPVKKTAQEIKECPFNPFGDDSCDMCGS